MSDRAPVYISWSSLRSHEFCKQQSYLYRTKRKNPAADIRSYFHGTVVDRVMRYWLDDDDPQPGEMATMVRDVIDQEELLALNNGDGIVRWKNKSDRETMTDWCIELVNKLEPILYERVIPYQYEVAKRFRTEVTVPWLDGSPTKIYLAGEMDLLIKDNGGNFVIWDLKGTADNNYWRKTLGQLVFYDISTHAMFGQYPNLTGLIQPMCKEKVLEFRFSEDDRRAMWSRILRMVSDIWLKDFEPKEDSAGCSWCSVRHACAKYAPPEMTTGPQRLSLSGMLQVGKEANLLETLNKDR